MALPSLQCLSAAVLFLALFSMPSAARVDAPPLLSAAIALGTPPFAVEGCDVESSTLAFRPHASRAQLAPGAQPGECLLQPDAPGDYIVTGRAPGLSDLRLRGVPLDDVDYTLFADGFNPASSKTEYTEDNKTTKTNNKTNDSLNGDSDATTGNGDRDAGLWLPAACAGRSGVLTLPSGCVLATAAARLNPLREDVVLALGGIIMPPRAVLAVGIDYAPKVGVYVTLAANGTLNLRAADTAGEHLDHVVQLALPTGAFALNVTVGGLAGNVTVDAPNGQHVTVPHNLAMLSRLGSGTGAATLTLASLGAAKSDSAPHSATLMNYNRHSDNHNNSIAPSSALSLGSLLAATPRGYGPYNQPRSLADVYPSPSLPVQNVTATLFPLLGSVHADSLALSLLDVTRPPFAADPTGSADATAALRAATLFAWRHNLVAFLPDGTYTLSDTLSLTQYGELAPSNRRMDANILRGDQRPGARTVLRLAPHATGFGNASAPKCFLQLDYINPTNKLQPNDNMNQVIQGVCVEVGAGNVGAVAVRARGAQGTGLQDVVIEAGDALVGLLGGSGSGGAHHNVTVRGGAFGADLRQAQPAATLSGLVLEGQRCAALVYDGISSLTVVGAAITDTAGGSGYQAVAAGRCAPGRDITVGGCLLPALADGQPCNPAYEGQLALVDTVIDASASGRRAQVVDTNSNVYLRNVFVRGFSALAWLNTTGTLLGGKLNAGTWTNVSEALGAQPSPAVTVNGHTYQYERAVYVDGVRSVSVEANLAAATGAPPSDLVVRHTWGPAELFPSFQTAHISVRDAPYNAVGNGHTDDTVALQAALTDAANMSHRTVYLPPGAYALSRGLVAPGGVRIVGTAHAVTMLLPTVAATAANASFTLLTLAAGGTTSDALGSVLFGVNLISWDKTPGVAALRWQATLPRSVFRQAATWIEPGPWGYGLSSAGQAAGSFAAGHTQPMITIEGVLGQQRQWGNGVKRRRSAFKATNATGGFL